jgi:hypothetical protein
MPNETPAQAETAQALSERVQAMRSLTRFSASCKS